MKAVSIRRLTWSYFSAVILVAVLGMLLVSEVARRSLEDDSVRHRNFESNVLQRHFSEMLTFYKNIAVRLSGSVDAQDILEFRDRERAIAWAEGVRRLLPGSIGVALVDTDGQILGEPLQLNLGKQCVTDLNHMLAGEHVSHTPIHRDNGRHDHFDVVQEVRRDGELLGMIFISFSLDVVKERVNRVVSAEQVLLVEDQEGNLIASNVENTQAEHMGANHSRLSIDDSDWRLHYMSQDSSARGLARTTLLVSGFVVACCLVVMVIFTIRLIFLFKRDLVLIKGQLSALSDGGKAELPHAEATLTETREIMHDVWGMVGSIEQLTSSLKILSVHDELSGLLNRRGFNDKLESCWELSGRGSTAALLLLDLDYFKRVNDQMGHAVGDRVIAVFAAALEQHTRKTDVIARLGGDEFAVILNSCQEQAALAMWYEKFTASFHKLQAEFIPDSALYCSVSAGAVALSKKRYEWLQKQIEAADRALYRAKEQGRGRLVCDLAE